MGLTSDEPHGEPPPPRGEGDLARTRGYLLSWSCESPVLGATMFACVGW